MYKTFYTKCIVCNEILDHKIKGESMLCRCAHVECGILMRTLRKLTDSGNPRMILPFAQKCIQYEINPTKKALYVQLRNRYQ